MAPDRDTQNLKWRTIKQVLEMVCEVQQSIRVYGGHNAAGLTRRLALRESNPCDFQRSHRI
jgi:hypothetical protein